MKLIVGLGNPGEEYEKTRHNLGFMVINQLVKDIKCPPMGFEKKLKCEIAGYRFENSPNQFEPLLLVKPQTYMNQSGEAIKLALDYYKGRLTIEDLWVIHDDVDLPLGRLKIQSGGGTGGHHGLESIVQTVGSGFVRFRIGIGRSKRNIYSVYDFVLQPFIGEEQKIVSQTTIIVSAAIQKSLKEGISVAMNQYNGRH